MHSHPLLSSLLILNPLLLAYVNPLPQSLYHTAEIHLLTQKYKTLKHQINQERATQDTQTGREVGIQKALNDLEKIHGLFEPEILNGRGKILIYRDIHAHEM